MKLNFVAQKISKLIADAIEMYSADRFDTEILLSSALKKPREWIVSNPDFFVPWIEDFTFQRLVAKRAKGMPVAYLTGHKEFFGFDFIVNKDTLIPRPDTEILVEDAVKEIEKNEHKKCILIDVGTGSGCIPISITKTLKNKNPKFDITVFATDISKKALAIAKKNARKHFVEINFSEGNLLEPLFLKKSDWNDTKIIVTANLPYLTQEQFESEPSIQYEPHGALVADDRGLALYKHMLEQIQTLSVPLTTYFEIDPSQAEALLVYIHTLFPHFHTKILKDLCGRDRIIKIQSSPTLSHFA